MNLYRTSTALAASALLLSSASLAFDREAKPSDETTSEHPQFLQLDDFFGSVAQGFAAQDVAVEDALIDADSGCIVGVVMDNGLVSSFDRMRWNHDGEQFVRTDAVDRKQGSNVSEASAKTSNERSKHETNLERTYMLSSLMDLPLYGAERTEDGKRMDVELGSIGSAFLDARSGHVAYVTTSVGGVLGLGAESRVIPWSAIDLERDAEGNLVLGSDITEERLDEAPRFGEGPENLDNPLYRDTLYSYYGTKRADFEPQSTDELSLVPLDDLIGATIRRGEDHEDALEDVVIDPKTGQAPLVISESGDVLALAGLDWDLRNRQFREQGNARKDSGSWGAADGMILASTLSAFDVVCDGETKGSVEDVYMDTRSGKIAYLAVDYDGVRVLPWSVVKLQKSEDTQRILLNCTAQAVKSAPELDGKIGSTVYHPDFRRQVDKVAKQ